MVDFPLEELIFCAKYPFSRRARNVVQKINPALDEISPQIKELAKSILKNAIAGKAYEVTTTKDKDALKRQILAYHVAKIMVSLLNNEKYSFYFGRSFQKSTFNFLNESKRADTLSPELEALANDFGINFSSKNVGGKIYIRVPLLDFLSAPSKDESLKLLNQNVYQGMVFLDENRFARFLAEKAMVAVSSQLVLKEENVPLDLKELAFESLSESIASKKESKTSGVNLEAMPPCMDRLYSDIIAGRKLSHMENFALATFLAAIGFNESKLLEVFSHAPNYNEKIARYHISRILKGKQGKSYKPLSCSKMQSYGFCVANCGVNNPLSYYRKALVSKQVVNNATAKP